MAVPKVNPRTILLVGKETSIMKEGVCGGAMTPGHLVALNSAGKWVVHPSAGGVALRAFVVEADYNGKGIDDAFAADDWAQVWLVPPGAEVNALVAPSAAAIAVGDWVESAGNGTVRKLAAGTPLGQAIQAVDNSGNAVSSARIQILIK
jgi:hypothetical protein